MLLVAAALRLPPDQEARATELVLQQAEVIAAYEAP